jgi:hypothetical protein
MKTPQLEHGVYDIATGEEITTPLGLPRDPATVLVDHYIATAARMEILERLDEINQWFDKNPYWRLTDDHRDFKRGHAFEMEQLELTEKLREIEGGEAL